MSFSTAVRGSGCLSPSARLCSPVLRVYLGCIFFFLSTPIGDNSFSINFIAARNDSTAPPHRVSGHRNAVAPIAAPRACPPLADRIVASSIDIAVQPTLFFQLPSDLDERARANSNPNLKASTRRELDRECPRADSMRTRARDARVRSVSLFVISSSRPIIFLSGALRSCSTLSHARCPRVPAAAVSCACVEGTHDLTSRKKLKACHDVEGWC